MPPSKITIKSAQQLVDAWIKKNGVRYFNELTNTVILMEEVGELARIIARKYGEQSFKDTDLDKNMADADIFQREANPPNILQWGKRVYYYNCSRKAGNYKWFANNLPANVNCKMITAAWSFDYKWNPANENIGNQPEKTVSGAVKNVAEIATDPVAENMLLYQRANGGWPKHFQGDKKVDYKYELTGDEKLELVAGYGAGIGLAGPCPPS